MVVIVGVPVVVAPRLPDVIGISPHPFGKGFDNAPTLLIFFLIITAVIVVLVTSYLYYYVSNFFSCSTLPS